MRKILILLAMGLLLGNTNLHAEEQFGIPVYKGAKYEAGATKFLQEAMTPDAVCYRTADSMAQVIEFYKAQPELSLINEDDSGAFFRRCQSEEYNKLLKMTVPKDCDLDITIQSPWMDMGTQRLQNDTLISFVKR